MRLSGTHLGDLRRVLGLLEVRVCGVGGVGGGDWIGICLFLFFMIERGLSLSESMRNWIFEFQVPQIPERGKSGGGGGVEDTVRYGLRR